MVQVLVCVLHGVEANYNMHAVFVEGQIATNAADLWTIEVETPDASVSGEGDSPPVMIDYVHPGEIECFGHIC